MTLGNGNSDKRGCYHTLIPPFYVEAKVFTLFKNFKWLSFLSNGFEWNLFSQASVLKYWNGFLQVIIEAGDSGSRDFRKIFTEEMNH